jgi:hypothetical protein
LRQQEAHEGLRETSEARVGHKDSGRQDGNQV